MTYQQALDYLNSREGLGSRLGLGRMERLLAALGSPEKSMHYVHVAGTNGKGSTSAHLAAMLQENGYTTGLYTSPYIETFCERIRVNGENIPEEEVGRLMGIIKAVVDTMADDPPTVFEIMTAMGFLYFHVRGVELAVLEVGMGGRFDATNVIIPDVCVITPIAYDHMEILGDTLAKIAFEKAGILKPGVPVVFAGQVPEAMETLTAQAERNGAKILAYGRDFSAEGISSSLSGQRFAYRDENGSLDIEMTLLGAHQIENASVAYKTMGVLKEQGYRVETEACLRGMKQTRWPARFEVLHLDPVIILDGSHNLAGMQTLYNGIREYLPGQKVNMVIGVLKDKAFADMVTCIAPLVQECRVLPVNSYASRNMNPSVLVEEFHKHGVPAAAAGTIREALSSFTKPDSATVVCGSLYLAGEVRPYLRSLK